MNLKPLGDRVVVEVVEEEEITVSGIVLPDSAKEKPQRGACSQSAPALEDGKCVPLEVRTATRCCTASTAAPRSRSTATST